MTADESPVLRLTDDEFKRIHASLVRTFRAAGLPDPENLASDVFQRTLVHLHGGEGVNSLQSYLRGVAANLVREERRRLSGENRVLAEIAYSSRTTRDSGLLANHLAHCFSELSPADQALLTRYYSLDGNAGIRLRRTHAKELGITVDALTMRVFRLRQRLYNAVLERLGRKDFKELS